MTIAEALAIGTRHHQAGQLVEAEKIYRQILDLEPKNAQALHLMGLVALQSRQFESAVELIGRAIRADRSQAAFHANLGEALRHLQRTPEAIASYRQAIALQPNLAHSHAMLGTLLRSEGKLDEAAAALRTALRLKPDDNQSRARLGHILHDQNQLTDAEACFRRVVRDEPSSAEAHFNLASVLDSQGKRAEAEAGYCQALQLQPDYGEAHNNLGAILQARGELDEAAEHFHRAVQANPQSAAGHVNLGTNHQLCRRWDEAARCYQAALELEPANVTARNGLGGVWLAQGRTDEALACFQAAVEIDPRVAVSHLNVGTALQALGRLDAAAGELEEALRLDPNNADAYNNIGMIRNEQGRRDEAIEACRRAIEINPRSPQAYNNLGVAMMALGRLDEGIEYARQASQLSPLDSPHHSNRLYMLNYHPGYEPAAIFDEHRQWAQRHADPFTRASAPHGNDRTPDRRLRIGYVSAHFMSHAVNFFSEPILASHDHSRFEVYCYAHLERGDETTERLRGYADHWRDIAHLNDDEASQLVRDDQIDILVDLTGHIGGNRLLLFARKPAPVQVTYIGYQNTTGMLAMDYRLTDAWADPPGETDDLHTEKLVRLPKSFFCYQPSADAPEVNSLPALENGYVTFGSFNAFPKVTPDVLATWARLLDWVAGSRLVILANATPSLVERVATTFESHGISADRLTVADRRPRSDYLELIRSVDIALDPFPFGGHTTTCDALWQGVPVVALAGRTYVSRFGTSAHVNLGLEELVGHTPDEYVQIAADLAGDLDRLAELRGGLRDRMRNSPLLDFAGFTRSLEHEYRQMWIRWCAASTM